MKYKLISLFVFVAAFALMGIDSVYAFDGIKGTVVDSKTKSPWLHGGSITIFDQDDNNAPCGSGVLQPNGSYSVLFTSVTCGPNLIILVDPAEAPGGGDPAPQLQNFFNDPNQTGMAVVNFETGTGPTAVSMATTNADSTVDIGWQISVAFTLLGAATMWALSRRQLAQLLK